MKKLRPLAVEMKNLRLSDFFKFVDEAVLRIAILNLLTILSRWIGTGTSYVVGRIL